MAKAKKKPGKPAPKTGAKRPSKPKQSNIGY